MNKKGYIFQVCEELYNYDDMFNGYEGGVLKSSEFYKSKKYEGVIASVQKGEHKLVELICSENYDNIIKNIKFLSERDFYRLTEIERVKLINQAKEILNMPLGSKGEYAEYEFLLENYSHDFYIVKKTLYGEGDFKFTRSLSFSHISCEEFNVVFSTNRDSSISSTWFNTIMARNTMELEGFLNQFI